MIKSLAFALLVVSVFSVPAVAAEKVLATTITIDGEMCSGCVKKLTSKLIEVPGVRDIKGDVKAKTMTITPASGANVSPLSLWEAVEKAGKKPGKLVGPRGTFTSKPKA